MFFPVLSLPGQTIFMIIQPCYSHNPNYCSTAFPWYMLPFLLQHFWEISLTCTLYYPTKVFTQSTVIPHFDYYFCILRGPSTSQPISNFQPKQNSPAKNPPTLMTLQLHCWPSSDPLLTLFYLLQLVHTSCLPPTSVFSISTHHHLFSTFLHTPHSKVRGYVTKHRPYFWYLKAYIIEENHSQHSWFLKSSQITMYARIACVRRDKPT